MDEQIEIDLDLLQKGKTRKKVWVKPTATKKGYYREQEVGQKEEINKFKRARLQNISDLGLEIGDKVNWRDNIYEVKDITDDAMVDIGGELMVPSAIIEVISKDKPKPEKKPEIKEEKPKKDIIIQLKEGEDVNFHGIRSTILKIDYNDKKIKLQNNRWYKFDEFREYGELAEETENIEMGKYIDEYKSTFSGRKVLKSIREYTDTRYRSINKYLRSGKPDYPGDEKILDQIINDLKSFIKDAPKCSDVVYRGMGFGGERDMQGSRDYKKVLSKFKEGKKVTVKSFTSATLSKSISDKFSDPEEYEYRIHFNIKSKSGVFLNGTSGSPDEMEVLFTNRSKFNVVKVKKGIDDKHTIIHLEEI